MTTPNLLQFWKITCMTVTIVIYTWGLERGQSDLESRSLSPPEGRCRWKKLFFFLSDWKENQIDQSRQIHAESQLWPYRWTSTTLSVWHLHQGVRQSPWERWSKVTSTSCHPREGGMLRSRLTPRYPERYLIIVLKFDVFSITIKIRWPGGNMVKLLVCHILFVFKYSWKVALS